jgi:hypothetical protein
MLLVHKYNRTLHVIVYFYSIVTTLIYWFLLHYHHRCNGDCLFMTINIHGGVLVANKLYKPIEIYRNRNDFMTILSFGVVYHLWTIIYYFCTGDWIYEFMSIYKPLFIIVYAVLTIIFFLITKRN